MASAVISVLVTGLIVVIGIKALLAWLSRPTVHVHNNYQGPAQQHAPAMYPIPVYVPMPMFQPQIPQDDSATLDDELHGMIDGYYGDRRMQQDR